MKKRQMLLLSVLLFFLFINTFYYLFTPLIFKDIFDNALTNKDAHRLFFLLSTLLIVFILFVITSLIQAKCITKFSTLVTSHLHLKLVRHIQRTDFKNNSDNLEEVALKLLTHDIVFLQFILTYSIWSMLQNIIIIIISITLLIYLNWILALAIISFVFIILILPRYLDSIANRSTQEKQHTEIKLTGLEKEEISMHELIHLFHLRNFRRKEIKKLIKHIKTLDAHNSFYIILSAYSTLIGFTLVMLVTLGLGSYLVLQNQLTAGGLIGFLIILENFGAAIGAIANNYPQLKIGFNCYYNIKSFMTQNKTKNTAYGKQIFPVITKEISFKDVYFQKDSTDILSKINLNIAAGQRVAIVGQSGAGKSTLLKLLLRELPISSGHIEFDGEKSDIFSTNSFYSQVKIISQKPQLFSLSIKENIRMGNLSATDDEVLNAAKLAEIHDAIINFNQGYDTVVTQNNLSVGECQRITIARALLSHPTILCLDEITSALDPIAAQAIMQTLKKMSGSITQIYITHQLKFTQDMDYIFVINNGSLIQEGTHEHLMKDKQGLYCYLWQNDQQEGS